MSSATYETSTLWKTAFSAKKEGFASQREKLAGAYREFRGRVELLLQQIQRELPALTLHDITHVDALWHVASEIAGPDYELNPAEAFVLGGAFLLHDAAHCRAAFEGGITQLRDTVEWRDAAAQRAFSEDQLRNGTPEFQIVLFDTLRVLHPKQARKLPFAKWADGTGQALHLLPYDELREAYGHIIGELAESHWFDPHELEIFAAKTVTAPVCLAPATWTVNPLKIAVLLRVADAAHIDAKRAPRLLLAMNQPRGISLEHWRFQARLHQPHCDLARSELIFSGSPFPSSEQAAWWLAYDAACLANKELSAADHLLRDHGLQRLAAKEVAGAHNAEVFALKVPTQGWHPVDASLRISDTRSVIERFGGAKLYGDEPRLAVRELLQNARDAIMASRALNALEESEGSITVQLEEVDGEDWLHVTDTGIGMSRYVLTQVLLDFGRSLWRDATLRQEWPGLAATGFDAVGQHGIGFFSVFMLGQHVKVTTLRQSGGQQDDRQQWLLEFPQGLNARPSLREPILSEKLSRHGTRVSVKLLDKAKLLRSPKRSVRYSNAPGGKDVFLTIGQLVGSLAPTLEIDVFTWDAGGKIKTIQAGDWKTIEPLKLLERLDPDGIVAPHTWLPNELSIINQTLSPISDKTGEVIGRLAITRRGVHSYGVDIGVVTVGGLRGGDIRRMAGVLMGTQTDLLNRSIATPLIGSEALSTWANAQAKKLIDLKQLSWTTSTSLLAFGADPDDLFIACRDDEPWTKNQLTIELQILDEVWLLDESEYVHQPHLDDVTQNDFHSNFKIDSHILVYKPGLRWYDCLPHSDWPHDSFSDSIPAPLKIIKEILETVWSDAEWTEAQNQVIGHVGDTAVLRDVAIVRRSKAPAKVK